MMTGVFAVVGLLTGICAVRFNEFRGGGSFILLFIVGGAVCIAATGGIVGTFLPEESGIWFGRVALFALLFVVGTIFGSG